MANSKKLIAGDNIIKIPSLKANILMCKCLEPENGFYHLPIKTKHWEIGVSEGRFGRYCKIDGKLFSVNKGGNAWARVGSDKEERFLDAIRFLLNEIEDRALDSNNPIQ